MIAVAGGMRKVGRPKSQRHPCLGRVDFEQTNVPPPVVALSRSQPFYRASEGCSRTDEMIWRSKREPVRASREITIQNELGMHARPAAEFVRKANSFRSELSLVIGGKSFSATSVV